MDTIFVRETDFERNINNGNYESNLYRKDGIVYKFLKPQFREERDEILIALDKNPILHAIKPLALIKDYLTDEFLGYSMKDLIEYINVSDFIDFDFSMKQNGEKMSFENRKKACKCLIEFLRDSEKKGYGQHDLSTSNMMIIDGRTCITDVDSMYNEKLRLTRNKNSWFGEDYMEKAVIYAIASILLQYNNMHSFNTKSYYEFQNNPIIMYMFGEHKIDLIKEGYKAEDVYGQIDEELNGRLRYLLKRK